MAGPRSTGTLFAPVLSMCSEEVDPFWACTRAATEGRASVGPGLLP